MSDRERSGDANPAPALELSESQQAAIARLARDEVIIPPPIELAREAYLRNDAIERMHALGDPERFWSDKADQLDWMTPFGDVYRFDPPNHAWFLGGKLNATSNCIDRHAHSDRRNRAAIVWVGEDGEEQTYTYARLYREVNRFANALVALDGDRR